MVKYLIKSLDNRIYSIKKLMKLVFLAQYHIDRERRVVYEYRYGGHPLARAEFYIWTYGPMSDEVYEALESDDFDLVQRELGIEIVYAGPAPKLPQPVADRLDKVVREYGMWKPWQLEHHVNWLLDLELPEKKSDYLGVKLHVYLREEGYVVEQKELHG